MKILSNRCHQRRVQPCSPLVRLLLLAALLFASRSTLWALNPERQIGQYGHDSWTSQRGLPGEAVYQILQSKDGYLWIRTGSGLIRFDGVRFVSMDSAIGRERVAAMCMGADGDLLIRTATRTIIYKDRQFSDYLPPSSLPDGGTHILFENREHVVFIGSENFIYRMDKHGATQLLNNTGIIGGFFEDSFGTTWIGGAYALYTYANGRLAQSFEMKVAHDNRGAPRRIGTWALMEDHLHQLWAGTSDGLYRLDGYRTALHPSLQPVLPSSSRIQINTMLEDHQGNFWLGFSGAGVARFSGGAGTSLDVRTGLTDNDVQALFEDREGSIWIGTDSGLDRLRDTKLTTFTTREGMTADSVKTVLADHDGTLYAFCDGGGLACIRNDKVIPFRNNAKLASPFGAASYESKDGTLWIGTAHGLNGIKDGKVTVYDGGGVLSNNYISTISEDDESLIVADAESRAMRFKDGKVSPFLIHGQETPFTYGGHGSIYIFTMYFDPLGTLWLGTNAGLFKHCRGDAIHKDSKPPIASQVTSIYDDHRGNLWLGGRTTGLIQYRISDGRETRYGEREGLFDGSISHILPDASGNLWISTEDGIYETSQAELDDFADGRTRFVHSTRYSLPDGMKTTVAADRSAQPSGATTRDGRLWFATGKGIVVVDPRHLLMNTLVPPVVLESILTDGIVQAVEANLEVKPGNKSIEFHYTGLSFRIPERVRFKYQLEGYDHAWIDAGTRRVAYYTNLPPGKYRFHVIAANDDGLWNTQGATVTMVLRPHFYQTLWFFLLCILFAILVLIVINRRNTHMIRVRAEHLSKVVAERTAELEKSRLELEQIAHFDALTTLPNRRMFTDTFERMRNRTQRQDDGFSMLLIDFDKFKQINDTYGHDAGDAFLVEAAMRLRASVRSTDCVARLGGDEFAILLAGDQVNLQNVCDRIVDSFTAAIPFKSIDMRTSASVGAAIYPDHGRTQEELYKSADLALYAVKRKGRNAWLRFSPQISQTEETRDKVAI